MIGLCVGIFIGSVGILIGSVGIFIGSVGILNCRDHDCRDFDTNPTRVQLANSAQLWSGWHRWDSTSRQEMEKSKQSGTWPACMISNTYMGQILQDGENSCFMSILIYHYISYLYQLNLIAPPNKIFTRRSQEKDKTRTGKSVTEFV